MIMDRKILTFQERVDFVRDVMDTASVAVAGSDTEHFQHALFTPAFRMNVLRYFAGVKFDEDNSDEWLAKVYGDEYAEAIKEIPVDELNDLEEACRCEANSRERRYLTAALMSSIEKNPLNDFIAHLEELLVKAEEKMKGIDYNEVVGAMRNLPALDKETLAVVAAGNDWK